MLQALIPGIASRTLPRPELQLPAIQFTFLGWLEEMLVALWTYEGMHNESSDLRGLAVSRLQDGLIMGVA